MSALMANERVEYTQIKELLQVTDGNLASHLKALEKANYIEVHKKFIGRKPNTSYSATNEGMKAFQDHIDALESLINGD